MDTKEKLSRLTILLHWLVGVGILGMIMVGFYMKYGPDYSLYHTHKSLGIILFTFILARVFWRIKNGWPEHVANYTRFEVFSAKVVHWVLIIGIIVMPLSGMLLSGFSGHGFGIFEWSLFPSNHNAQGEVVAFNHSLYEFFEGVHMVSGFGISFAVVFHIAGALKHHFIDKDRTLLRMLGR